MKQLGLLFATFGGTLAVLLVAFLVIRQLGATSGGSTAASASPSASPLAGVSTPVPTARPSRSIPPRPSVPPDDPSPSPSPSPPTGTVAARRTPVPTPPPVAPGTVVEIKVPGSGFVHEEVPSNGTVTKVAGGGVILQTTREFSEPLTVTYKLPLYQLPSGIKVVRVDAALCGNASGDFWESYGPAGSEPPEDEVTPPGPDGCWHYLGGSLSDTAVFAIIRTETTFKIDRVVYTVTAG